MENYNEELIKKLQEKEKSSGLEYDAPKLSTSSLPEDTTPLPTPPPKSSPLGKASFVQEQVPLGMETPWKPLPLTNLPSEGFGYPSGLEIAIRACEVGEIRHYSTIDEYDPIDVDDKINHILSKNTQIRYSGGVLNYKDLYHEDRFYIFMVIRDITFSKGENKLILPITKECKEEKCILGNEIELRSNLLTSFKLPAELRKYYDTDKGCYLLTPKNGEQPIELFIPTIGIVTGIKKILKSKKDAGKKYDESFAGYSTFIIPNWRDLDDGLYTSYEIASRGWSYTQFNIVDQITKMITFATKNQIALSCSKCGAEVTAPLRFRGGLRSLYTISNIFGELL